MKNCYFQLWLTLLFGLISGCTSNLGKPDVQELHVPDTPEPTLTLDRLERMALSNSYSLLTQSGLGTANYYVALRVKGENIPTVVGACNQNVKALWQGLRQLVGIASNNEFLISATIKAKDQIIRKNMPILFVARYDPVDATGSKCVSWFNSKRITELFRSDASISFEVEYSIQSRNGTDVRTLEKLVGLVSASAGAFGVSTSIVSAWTTEDIKGIAKQIDVAASAGFTRSISTTSVATLPETGFGGRKDRFELNIDQLVPSLVNSKVAIELDYQPSVIGEWNSSAKKVDYPTQPNTLLALVTAFEGNNSTINERLNGNGINGVTAISLRGVTSKDVMRIQCQNINDYFASKVPLSENDQLAIRWAILTLHSNYNSNIKIRSDSCISHSEDGTIQYSDQDRLRSLNPNFQFRVIPDQTSWYETLSRLRAKISGSRANKIPSEEIFDVDKFELLVMDESILPIHPDGKSSWIGKGKEGVKNFLKLVQYPECSYVARTGPEMLADFTAAATNLRVLDSLSRGEHEPASGYYNKKIRLYVIPALLYLEQHSIKPRLTKVIMGNISEVRIAAQIPETWPTDISKGQCKNYSTQYLVWKGSKDNHRRVNLALARDQGIEAD